MICSVYLDRHSKSLVNSKRSILEILKCKYVKIIVINYSRWYGTHLIFNIIINLPDFVMFSLLLLLKQLQEKLGFNYRIL